MTNEDFETCVYIDNNMCFVTYADFCHKCRTIKAMYNDLTRGGKIFYKWYVYANVNMKTYYKDVIWEYLNEPDIQYYIALINLLIKDKK